MNTMDEKIANVAKPRNAVLRDSRASTVVQPTTEDTAPPKCIAASPTSKTTATTDSPSPRDPDKEIKSTITVPLQKYPRGYPRQAAFQSSESSFSIYRAFDYLHSRVLLELQDELRCLEENLVNLDVMDSQNGRERCVRSRAGDLKQAKRDGTSSKRAELLSLIREKLTQYDKMLVRARKLCDFQRPSSRDYRSLRRFFYLEKPLNYMPEEQFIQRKEDLLTLHNGREWSAFDGYVEEAVSRFPWKWLTRKLFATPELLKKSTNPNIFYYSPSRVEKLVSLIITLIIFILLVLPVVAMYELTCIGNRNNLFDAIGILVVFTLLFSAAMGLLTKAKRHELFAASAAYCAVLVVFISNFDGQNGGMGKKGGP